MSIAGACKWLLVLFSIPFWVAIYSAVSTGSPPLNQRELIQPTNQHRNSERLWQYVGINLGYVLLCFAAAWAVWYFWQRNED